MADKHTCPVCNEYEFERHNSFDTCEICGWTDDAVQQNNPNMGGCANGMSLKEAKENYNKKGYSK